MSTDTKQFNRFPANMTAADYDKLPATEMESLRTECGAVFTVGAGRYQAVTFAEPVHHYDEKTKQWQPIDRTMQPMNNAKADADVEADANAPVLMAKADHAEVELAPSGNEKMLTIMSEDDHQITIGIPCAVLPSLPLRSIVRL